jgi:hypothetical protein
MMRRDKFENHWFKHDFTASSDNKIIKLESRLGLKGYAVFWKLLEQIYLNEGCLEYNLEELLFTFRLENNESNKELIASVINDFDLFKIDDSGFFNVRAQEYLEYVLSKSKKASESAKKRYSKEEEIDEPEYIRKWNEEQEKKRNNNGF